MDRQHEWVLEGVRQAGNCVSIVHYGFQQVAIVRENDRIFLPGGRVPREGVPRAALPDSGTPALSPPVITDFFG